MLDPEGPISGGQVGRAGGGSPIYSEGLYTFICRIQCCGRHATPSRKDFVLVVGGGGVVVVL